MAIRTPLMRRIRELFGQSLKNQGAGASVDSNNRPSSGKKGMGRRSVLRAAAIGAGALALAGVPKIAEAKPGKPKPTIVIVGAGIAGLNAALTLKDAGVKSTIYESNSRVGGRMHTNRDWSHGQVTEWCGELIDSGHEGMIALCDRFGLELDDLKAADALGATDTFFFGNEYYSYAEANADFQALIPILVQQNEDAPFPTTYDSNTAEGRRLDQMSLWDWIETYVPGGHASKLGMLLDVAYDIEYGASTHDQTALNLVYLLPTESSDLSLFGYSDEQFHIRGGNDLLTTKMAKALPNDAIKFGYRLKEIKRKPNGKYKLIFEHDGCDVDVVADHVILALPFAVLRNLQYEEAGFDELKKIAIEQQGMGTNSKLHAQFENRFWLKKNKPWGNSTGSAFSDVGFSNCWEATKCQPGKPGILVEFRGSKGSEYHPAEDESTSATQPTRGYAEDFVARLNLVFPGIADKYTGLATLHDTKGDKASNGSYSFYRPGQMTLFAGYEGVPQGNCHFAGEHTSTDSQGYMEGAANEGARAALEILAVLAA